MILRSTLQQLTREPLRPLVSHVLAGGWGKTCVFLAQSSPPNVTLASNDGGPSTFLCRRYTEYMQRNYQVVPFRRNSPIGARAAAGPVLSLGHVADFFCREQERLIISPKKLVSLQCFSRDYGPFLHEESLSTSCTCFKWCCTWIKTTAATKTWQQY